MLAGLRSITCTTTTADKYDNIFTDITLNNNQQIVKIGDEEDAAAIHKIIDDRGLKAVTYREHENNVNHAKRMIQVLDPPIYACVRATRQ